MSVIDLGGPRSRGYEMPHTTQHSDMGLKEAHACPSLPLNCDPWGWKSWFSSLASKPGTHFVLSNGNMGRKWGEEQGPAHINQSRCWNKYFTNHHPIQKFQGAFISKEQQQLLECHSPEHWTTKGRRSTWPQTLKEKEVLSAKGEAKWGIWHSRDGYQSQQRGGTNEQAILPRDWPICTPHLSLDSFPCPQNMC